MPKLQTIESVNYQWLSGPYGSANKNAFHVNGEVGVMYRVYGNIKLANQYLGHNYSIFGTVIDGKKIGRTIGFPTANINIAEDYKLLPKNGVYVVSSEINNKLFYGMMNIGNNPTIGENEQSIEVHFFDLNEDIYNQKLKIVFLEHIRDEKKFNSIEELQSQLENDKKFSLDYIKEFQ